VFPTFPKAKTFGIFYLAANTFCIFAAATNRKINHDCFPKPQTNKLSLTFGIIFFKKVLFETNLHGKFNFG